jgi:hypothetical protein
MPLRSLALATLLALPLAAVAAEPNIQPGEWEMTTTTTFPGTPMPAQRQSSRQCLTPEDLSGLFEVDVEECEMTEMDMRSDGMTYVMTCAQEEGFAMTMHAEMRFLGDRSEGSMTAEMNTPMGPMQMEMLLEGTRIGDC